MPKREMVSPRRTILVMLGACVGALALAGALLAILGPGERGLLIALRATARWSFLLFWPAYVCGALPTLLGPRAVPFATSARDFGLGYASAHLVHAGLIVWLYKISSEPPVPQLSLVFFGFGLFWTYLLVLLSIRPVFKWFGSRLGWSLRQIGLHYIAVAFLVDFAKPRLKHDVITELLYLPFIWLGVAGIGLRLIELASRTWKVIVANSLKTTAHGTPPR